MRRISATLVFLLLGAHAVAAAQSRPGGVPTAAPVSDAAARGRFQAGQAFYDGGRYEEALVEFQAAWQLSQRPAMLINIANAAERALRFDVAAESLRHYLELVPAAPERDAMERRIARSDAAMARMNPGATVTTPVTAAHPTGTTTDTVTAAHPTETEPAHVAPPPIDLTPTLPQQPPAQASEGGAPIAAIVTLSGGGALAIGALITGLLANGTYSDLEAACPGGVCPPDRASDVSAGKSMALVSTVLTGLAVVAGGVGVVLLFVGGHDDEAPATRARLELGPGPAPLGATERVRF